MSQDPRRTQPTAIRLNVLENVLTVTWADGHESLYDGGYLRCSCPCARCRGHAPGEVEPPRWEDVEGVQVTGAEAVGAYALRFELSDGHDTGIYAFDWLRQACPSERDELDERGRPRPAGV